MVPEAGAMVKGKVGVAMRTGAPSSLVRTTPVPPAAFRSRVSGSFVSLSPKPAHSNLSAIGVVLSRRTVDAARP
eukprot:2631958-Pleurochrysis_carterae.AAC.2